MYDEKVTPTSTYVFGGGFILICLIGLIVLGMWGCPQYNVYQHRKEGEAQLANAQYSREVAVAEARAKMESAALLAVADTLRAVGVAKSNQIIGSSLRNNPEYLQWMWVDAIDKTTNQVIYVPAGNFGMPIMEANRFSDMPKNVQPTP